MNFFKKTFLNLQKFIVKKKQGYIIRKQIRVILTAWLNFELLWQRGHGKKTTPAALFIDWYVKNYNKPISLPPQDTLRSTLEHWLHKEISKSWANKQL
jgi:hypothetical protein